MTWRPSDRSTGVPQFNAHGFPRSQEHYFTRLEECLVEIVTRQADTQRHLLVQLEELNTKLDNANRKINALEVRADAAGI